MKTNILTAVVFMMASIHVSGQGRTCHSTLYLEKQKAKYPAFESKMNEIEQQAQEWTNMQDPGLFDKQHNPANRAVNVITIPVVVHVIHNGEDIGDGSNLSDQQIISQIEILNRDYRMLNVDSLDSSHPYWVNTTDSKIEFCLAKQDENGNPTTGITRTLGSDPFFSFNDADNVKQDITGGQDGWNPTEYLNIWIYISDPTEGLLGYATGPASLSFQPELDGVAIDYQYFGNTPNTVFPYNDGRTAVHEVGHWLNLRHIWGDATCGNDLVSDTQPAEDANFSCPSFPHNANNSCGSGVNGEMYMNYMDYVDDACMVMFTAGQATRMRSSLSGARNAIQNSHGCEIPTSIDHQDLMNASVHVSPNPCRGVCTVQISSESVAEKTQLSVTNVSGSILKSETIVPGSRDYKIDLSELKSGLYFVKIQHDGYTVTKKISVLN